MNRKEKNNLSFIFEDRKTKNMVRRGLPHLFQLAELDSSRAGKIGMEVGSLRERIIVALLIYIYGRENVLTQIPITKSEEDVRLFDLRISIKTISNPAFRGVKIVWTVDREKLLEFRENYYPSCDILLVQIVWGGLGKFCHIPLKVQERY